MIRKEISETDLDHILRHTEEIWEAFRGCRLFVTGGTGFVGKWLLNSFVYATDRLLLRAEAVVLSRNPAAFAAAQPRLADHPAIHMWQGDVRSFDFPPGEFSHAIHAATDVGASATPLATFDVAVTGTRRVLDFCRDRGLHDLLLISSGAVYGRQPPELERVKEDYPGAPSTAAILSAYGEGKRAAEWLTTAYAANGGPTPHVARCFAFVGPHLPFDSHFAVGNFMGDLLAGRTIKVNGDGSPIRTYLYAADLAIWLWVILARGMPGEAYNVGSEETVSIGDLARRVAASGSPPVPIHVMRTPEPGTLPDRYVPSTHKAQATLGLQTHITLDQALSRTLAWAGAGTTPRG